MWFTATAVVDGCTKSTVSWGATLNVCQLSERFWLDCVTVVVFPELLICPVPDTTCPPLGPACATAAVSERAARVSLRPDPFFLPRAISETATQPLRRWLQTSR
jgi:hypothetical protein